MKSHAFIYKLFAAVFFLLTALNPPAVRAQNFSVSPSLIEWDADDTTPKYISIQCSGPWSTDSLTAGPFRLSGKSGYGGASVGVWPMSVNLTAEDRDEWVFFEGSGGGGAVRLIQHGVVTPRPLPDPEPDPDPWEGSASDLPDSLSWIQRMTVTAAEGSSSYRDVTFYDGLGYPSQEVLVGASPGGLKSIYTPVVYDNMRRADARTYLPYAALTAPEVHDPLALTRQSSFYSSLPYLDTRPYAEKVYETSPVGRPLSVQREGQAWNAGGGHRSTISYRTNLASDAIPHYRILPGTGKAQYDGSWPEGTLRCTETQDEEGAVSRSFSDAFGRLILSETETGALLPGGLTEKARTLYVYDLRDSLCLVVQPEGMKALDLLPSSPVSSRNISLTPGNAADNGDIADKYCFVWAYDGRGNVLSEHVPGGGTTEYIYDARNRLVLRADGRMRPNGDAGPRRMILTLYDQFDRIVEEKYVSTNRAYWETLQRVIRDTVSHTMAPAFIESYLPTLQTLRSAEYFPFGSVTYATTGDGAFVPETGIAETADLETVRIKGLLKKETLHPAPAVDGTIPAGTPFVTRYYHYDYRGRVIQLSECWSDGRVRRISTKYSFTGDALATKETVSVAVEGTGELTNSLATIYTRDPRGRVLSCSRVLNGTDTLATVHYSYDDLGRLVGKSVGNVTNPALKADYAYDLHGWPRESMFQSPTGSGAEWTRSSPRHCAMLPQKRTIMPSTTTAISPRRHSRTRSSISAEVNQRPPSKPTPGATPTTDSSV